MFAVLSAIMLVLPPVHGQFGEMSWDRWAQGNTDAIMVTCPDSAGRWSYQTNSAMGSTSITFTVTCH